MYDDVVLRIPHDEPELWEILREQFFHVAEDFARPVETKDDALRDRFYRDEDGKTRRDGLRVIRYRNVGDELDNREHFLTMGRELLPYIAEALEQGKLTPEFVQQWGKLMFCHGYITSHVLDDSDDLTHQRAGTKGAAKRSKELQRRWVAHLISKLLASGAKRNAVEDDVVAYINKVINDPKLRGGFEVSWFVDILDETQEQLKTTYDEQRLTKKAILEISREEPTGLPPVPSNFQ